VEFVNIILKWEMGERKKGVEVFKKLMKSYMRLVVYKFCCIIILFKDRDLERREIQRDIKMREVFSFTSNSNFLFVRLLNEVLRRCL